MCSRIKPLLSLCIPTNGMAEWVIPAIESIYNQNCNEDMFEVIVTDNGSDFELEDLMHKYKIEHKNLIYKKTSSILFQNQIDCFKLANGELVKFINHRSLLKDNTIKTLIEYANKFSIQKPIIYFLNNCEKSVDSDNILNFDDFMYNLSYYSSWSGGISCWRSDFSSIFNKDTYDNYFPHLDILFAFKTNRSYLICNKELIIDQKYDVSKKGRYDLFDAFAVHFLDIINNLYKNCFISKKTFDKIKRQNLVFVISLHFEYIVKRTKCSYMLNDFWGCFNKYYSLRDFLYGYLVFLNKLFKRVINKFLKFNYKNEK